MKVTELETCVNLKMGITYHQLNTATAIAIDSIQMYQALRCWQNMVLFI